MFHKKIILVVLLYIYYPTLLSAPLQIIDATNTQITFSQKAKRIISLAPNLTELIFSAGAGNRLVGTVQYSNYPKQANNIPVIGSYNNINLKIIIKLHPDIVFAWLGGNSKKLINQLRLLNIKVVVLSINTLQQITTTLKTIGTILGTTQIANKNAAWFQHKLNLLKPKKYNGLRVFIQIWHKPLITLNKNSIFSEVVSFCGGINIFANSAVKAPKVGAEMVLKKSPDIIILTSKGSNNLWERFVVDKKIFYIESDYVARATLRTINAVERICKILNKQPGGLK